MIGKYLPMLLFGLAVVLFVCWFIVANGLRRDASSEAQVVDPARRKAMTRLMMGGFAALLTGMLVLIIG